jgi:hypothetical protein
MEINVTPFFIVLTDTEGERLSIRADLIQSVARERDAKRKATAHHKIETHDGAWLVREDFDTIMRAVSSTPRPYPNE